MSKDKIEEKHELSTSIYMSGYGLLRKDCDDIAEQLYNLGYRKQRVGEWLLIKVPTGVEAFGIREVQAYPKCSICGYMGDVSEWHFKYCPNCGAYMRKEDEGK